MALAADDWARYQGSSARVPRPVGERWTLLPEVLTMCGGTLRKSLLMLGAGAWLLGSVTCVPTGDQIRYIVQSDILALISGTIQVIFGAAVQAVTTASQA